MHGPSPGAPRPGQPGGKDKRRRVCRCRQMRAHPGRDGPARASAQGSVRGQASAGPAHAPARAAEAPTRPRQGLRSLAEHRHRQQQETRQRAREWD